jgi:OFA family oxalate/formate antiporter-like MFS transporter
MNDNKSHAARGWTVVIAGLSINLILGVLYAWSVIAKALQGQWHWSKTDATLPFTVATVCFAGMMVFAGRCQDKFGPRLVATAGGIILGLGLVLSGLVHSPLAMAISFGVGAGLGIGLGYSATTPPAIKWFPPARKGVITGIVVSGVGLATVYIAPLSKYLLGITTISMTFVWLGVGTLILVPLLSQLLKNPPEQPASSVSSSKIALAPRRESDWQEMLRTPQFYQLWLLMVLSISAGMMIITQAPFIAGEQANMKVWDFLPIAILAIFNTFGRLLDGALSDRIGRTRTMTLAFLLQAANMLAFSHYNTPRLVIFGAAFTGICYGGIFTLMPATTADFYGIRNLGVNYGLVFTGFGIAGVIGPMLGAGINDHFKSYDYAYLISAVMLMLGAVLALFTNPPVARPVPAPVPAEPAVSAAR